MVPGVCVGHSTNAVCVMNVCCVICVGVVPVVYVCVCAQCRGIRVCLCAVSWYSRVCTMCSMHCVCVCKRSERERDTNQQDPLIQAIMGCAKVTSEVLELRFWSSTFGDTWKWAQIGKKRGQEGWETGASIGFFYWSLIPQGASTLPGNHPPCLASRYPPAGGSRQNLRAQTWVHSAAEVVSRSRRRAGPSSAGPWRVSRENRGGPGEGALGAERRAGEGMPERLFNQRSRPIAKRLACGTGDRGESFWLRFSRRNRLSLGLGAPPGNSSLEGE